MHYEGHLRLSFGSPRLFLIFKVVKKACAKNATFREELLDDAAEELARKSPGNTGKMDKIREITRTAAAGGQERLIYAQMCAVQQSRAMGNPPQPWLAATYESIAGIPKKGGR
jgi:hypothetical protein